MSTVWLSLLAETVVVTGIAAALARWSRRRYSEAARRSGLADRQRQ